VSRHGLLLLVWTRTRARRACVRACMHAWFMHA
jgi:hypothetical protein